MDKKEQDRKLMEHIDSLVSGHSRPDTEHIDDDTRSALDVTRKMASLRSPPSQEFKAGLKAQIVHQLAEQEKKTSARQSLFFWDLSRRKMWQGTIAALIVLAVAAVIMAAVFLLKNTG